MLRAVISVATHPGRIRFMEPALGSLCRQGLPVWVWAVPQIVRAPERLGAIPAFFRRPGVTVRVVADQGPATKLLPAIAEARRLGFEAILTADDDMAYGDGWADGLLRWADAFPRSALAYRGRRFRGTGYAGSEIVKLTHAREPEPVDLLTGDRGALYRPEWFGEDVAEACGQCRTNDDIAVSAYLRDRDIERLAVPWPAGLWFRKLPHRRVAAAFSVNKRGVNEEAVRRLGFVG